MTDVDTNPPGASPRPFQLAMLRGLGVIMPPLLTLVLILWALNTIDAYVLQPIEDATRAVIVTSIRDVREFEQFPEAERRVEYDSAGAAVGVVFEGRFYVPVGEQWLPKEIHDVVRRDPGETIPATAEAFYRRYVTIRWLRRSTVFPFFLSLFILVLYFLGKYMAAGAGRILVSYFEGMITRLPLVSNVYSSVKQVTDFVVAERSVEYNRVVAVEFPRKGIWSIGFVTGEGMLDIRAAANEPVLTVLLPTSPMPATGFTVTIRKSEAIDLNITIDQAIQFIVSCGVVIPPGQLQELAKNEPPREPKDDGSKSDGPAPAKSHDASPAQAIGAPIVGDAGLPTLPGSGTHVG